MQVCTRYEITGFRLTYVSIQPLNSTYFNSFGAHFCTLQTISIVIYTTEYTHSFYLVNKKKMLTNIIPSRYICKRMFIIYIQTDDIVLNHLFNMNNYMVHWIIKSIKETLKIRNV